jgi:hypothetical protein
MKSSEEYVAKALTEWKSFSKDQQEELLPGVIKMYWGSDRPLGIDWICQRAHYYRVVAIQRAAEAANIPVIP